MQEFLSLRYPPSSDPFHLDMAGVPCRARLTFEVIPSPPVPQKGQFIWTGVIPPQRILLSSNNHLLPIFCLRATSRVFVFPLQPCAPPITPSLLFSSSFPSSLNHIASPPTRAPRCVTAPQTTARSVTQPSPPSLEPMTPRSSALCLSKTRT
jgi:hypothetical protein